VSQRRCCCNGGGDCYCFCFETTAKHVQGNNLQCQAIPCEIEAGEPCGTLQSWSVANSYTGSFGEVTGQQQFVVYSGTGEDPCVCADQACVYSYSVTPTSFTRDVCFNLRGASWPLPQTSTSGEITVSIVANNVACPGTVWCGCCGTGRAVVRIEFEDYIPSIMVDGDCGEAEAYNIQVFTDRYLWGTRWELEYCWHYGGANPDPCTLTLVKITANGTNAVQSYGLGAYGGNECDCNNGDESHPTAPTAGKSACAPFTSGDALLLYQLAGSPPLTLTCSKCPCPEE
jgi:hypothetical protein